MAIDIGFNISVYRCNSCMLFYEQFKKVSMPSRQFEERLVHDDPKMVLDQN